MFLQFFFNFVVRNTIHIGFRQNYNRMSILRFVDLFDRYLTTTKWKLLQLYHLEIKFSITNSNGP
jgi:hypothetical protein